MLTTLSASAQQFLTSLDRLQERMNHAQRQISSGKRVETAADAPDQVSMLLQLHANIQRNQDIQDGLARAKTEVSTGEQALSTAIDLIERAQVLASQGTGPLLTADTRSTIAKEVTGIMEQLVALANSTVEGRYLFSGDLDQAPSYQLNLTAAQGVDRLQVAGATRLAQAPDGATFPVSRTANEIFDHRDSADMPAADNVFAALNTLRARLEANDAPGIQGSITALGTAATYLNGQLAYYGHTHNRIGDGLARAQAEATQLTVRLSGLQDSDAAAAILALTESQTNLQAALQSRALLPRTSLFDLL